MIGIDPRIVKTFVEWADYMYPDLSEFGVVAGVLAYSPSMGFPKQEPLILISSRIGKIGPFGLTAL